MRSGDVRRGREGRKRDDEGRDDWGRGDKRELWDWIRAIDMVICFPKGVNGAYHVLLGVTGGSVSRWVLNDDGVLCLATTGEIKINYRRAT
jgi:hypothetical protein